MVNVFKSVTGVFVENTYFLVNTNEKWGVIVDPGQGALDFLKQLKMEEISWKAIFLTHAHFDHLLGLEVYKTAANTTKFFLERSRGNYNWKNRV